MITSIIPASAASNDEKKDKIDKGTLVYTSNIGNTVYKANSVENVFVVFSKPITFNKLQADGTKEPAKRMYFQYASSLEEARKVADVDPEAAVTDGDVSLLRMDFWNGSWIDDIFDFWYGIGLYLSPLDAAYVKDLTMAASAIATSIMLLFLELLQSLQANLIQGLFCLTNGAYLGQALTKGTFREYWWLSTNWCIP